MAKLVSYKKTYQVVGGQEIGVDIYLPENAKKCPVGRTVIVHADSY